MKPHGDNESYWSSVWNPKTDRALVDEFIPWLEADLEKVRRLPSRFGTPEMTTTARALLLREHLGESFLILVLVVARAALTCSPWRKMVAETGSVIAGQRKPGQRAVGGRICAQGLVHATRGQLFDDR